jgi:hypothetical protein
MKVRHLPGNSRISVKRTRRPNGDAIGSAEDQLTAKVWTGCFSALGLAPAPGIRLK